MNEQTQSTKASTGAAPSATPAPTAAPVSAPHMTQPLAELQAAILADGVIDTAEVTQIRQRVFADGSVDKAEAEFLFALGVGEGGHLGHRDTHQEKAWLRLGLSVSLLVNQSRLALPAGLHFRPLRCSAQ